MWPGFELSMAGEETGSSRTSFVDAQTELAGCWSKL